MKTTRLFLLLGLIFAGAVVFAQSAKLKSGSFSALKGQTTVLIQYDYNNLKVGKKAEEDYIKEKVESYNKKKEGDGDRWLEAWKNDRPTRYQPHFEQQFNESSEGCGIKIGADYADAKYTLILKTDIIEPGFNVGVTRQNAYIDVTLNLVETANPSTILGTAEVKKAPGSLPFGYDFDSGVRISEAYEKAGKILGKFVCK